MQYRCAGFFPQRHGALGVENAAIASIGVGEDRDRGDPANSADMLEHLRLRENAKIRLPGDNRGRGEPADVDRWCTGLLGELCRDGVMRAHANKGWDFQELTKSG